ncbi:light-regulated zinc finger protein 1 [Actinidia rufa]|uniref:Light-regulated zinc finger protein 1 n=1 Tax=Actinidia rufa TaxID=165716 RepID=A0A7J0G2Q8_9ERIC|nr:light-regulated zinc finger protein 1 [Actinidia rufa]
MKIQCNVCEMAEANVLCCADEAALCWACDEKVHAANKLASKHQRVSLSTASSPMPKCDICQVRMRSYYFSQKPTCGLVTVGDGGVGWRWWDRRRHVAAAVMVCGNGGSRGGKWRWQWLKWNNGGCYGVWTAVAMVVVVAVMVKGWWQQRQQLDDEAVGYFFCLEDRALLCRKCDVAIHTSNTHVSAHRRFLLTGVKVGLEPGGSLSPGKSPPGKKISEIGSCSLPTNGTPISSAPQYNKVLPGQLGGAGNFAPTKLPLSGGSAAGSISQWHFDEYFELSEFNQTYGYMDNSSSKADSGKHGESDCSSILRAGEEDLDADELLGQVPDASWMVPQVPSPPTASGLYWPRSNRSFSDAAVFVPDICNSPVQTPNRYHASGTSSKRQRQF